jgi:hypothetical protein
LVFPASEGFKKITEKLPEHQRVAIISKEDPTTRSPATRKRFDFGHGEEHDLMKKSGFGSSESADMTREIVKSVKSMKTMSDKDKEEIVENNHSSSTSSTASGQHLFEEFLVVGVDKDDLIAFDETNPSQG